MLGGGFGCLIGGDHIYLHIYPSEARLGQVTIYLDEDTEAKARAAAASKGVSLSKWVVERIERGTRAEWPAFVREMEGAWADLPSAEQLRKKQGKDVKRGRL